MRQAQPVPLGQTIGQLNAALERARRAQAPRRLTLVLEWMRQPTFSVASAGLLAAAALAIGFVARGALSTLDEQVPRSEAASPSASVRSATWVT